jgi:hypothetical protein
VVEEEDDDPNLNLEKNTFVDGSGSEMLESSFDESRHQHNNLKSAFRK